MSVRNPYAVRSQDENRQTRAGTVGNRLAALVIWCFGLGATWLLFSGWLPTAPWYVALAPAFVTQVILTWVERGAWRGMPSSIAFSAVFLDALLNAGGVYPFMKRLPQTSVGVMLTDVLGSGTVLHPFAAIVAAFLLGLFTAAAPENLWRRKE